MPDYKRWGVNFATYLLKASPFLLLGAFLIKEIRTNREATARDLQDMREAIKDDWIKNDWEAWHDCYCPYLP